MARLEPQSPAETGLSYNSLLDTLYSGAASFAQPLEAGGVLGAGLLYLSQAPQTYYDAQGNPTGFFTPYDLDLSLSYARRVGDVLLGGTAKFIRDEVADAHGDTAALDLGIQETRATELAGGPIDVGADVTQIGPGIRVGTVSSPLPLKAAGGMYWHATPDTGFGMDVNFPEDFSPYVTLAFETELRSKSWTGALRAGFNQKNLQSQAGGLTGITLGAGLDIRRVALDYAWIPFGLLGATNRITVIIRF